MKEVQKTKAQLFSELEELRRIIPVCASCNKVRTDEDYWETVWGYLGRRVGVEVTHGLCPDCLAKFISEHKIP